MNDRAKHNVTPIPDGEQYLKNNNSVHSVYVDPETERRLVEAERKFRRARSGSLHDSILPRQVDDVWTNVNKLSTTSCVENGSATADVQVKVKDSVLKEMLRSSAPITNFCNRNK